MLIKQIEIANPSPINFTKSIPDFIKSWLRKLKLTPTKDSTEEEFFVTVEEICEKIGEKQKDVVEYIKNNFPPIISFKKEDCVTYR